MHRECRGRFPRHRLQRKPQVTDAGMHHGTYVTYVPWCMSGLLTRGGGESVPGIPGACANRNFTYLVRGPWTWHESVGCLTDVSPMVFAIWVIAALLPQTASPWNNSFRFCYLIEKCAFELHKGYNRFNARLNIDLFVHTTVWIFWFHRCV